MLKKIWELLQRFSARFINLFNIDKEILLHLRICFKYIVPLKYPDDAAYVLQS